MQNKISRQALQDIIQWDVKNWGKAIAFWEDYYLIEPGMKVLAIGERGGGLSLYFALKGCDVVCTDFRDFPESTKKLHEKYGVSSRITYAQADMRTLDFADETFDIVVFKSVIGALDSYDDSMKSLNDIHRVLKKGGAFLFAENSTASAFHRLMRKLFVEWEAKWRYVPDSEFEIWKKNYSAAFSEKTGFVALFGRTEWQRKFLGQLDTIFSIIIPRSWRYIYFGAFIKWGVSSHSR